jgi:N-ethylmaleimide reductase
VSLLAPYRLGSLPLQNRIAMAPMTRSRAIGGVPNELMRDYYAQRATAGLLITEGTAPSPNGLGYSRIPGLYSPEQVAGWRVVTDAVHQAGGRIFAQIMHTGRISHALNMPKGARILAPSAVAASGTQYTDQEGPQPFPTPEAMSADDVQTTREEFVSSAKNAIAAGFDGVELHGANGYLLAQFMHPHTNRRIDNYGGNIENRGRFVVEVAQAVAAAIGPERTAIRFSPFNTYNDLPAYDDDGAQHIAVAGALRGFAFMHVIQNPHEKFGETLQAMREAFGGPLMLNGGFDKASAEAALAAGRADLISFGRPFIANPDFVARLEKNAPLAEASPALFFSAGREGYLDFPLHGA